MEYFKFCIVMGYTTHLNKMKTKRFTFYFIVKASDHKLFCVTVILQCLFQSPENCCQMFQGFVSVFLNIKDIEGSENTRMMMSASACACYMSICGGDTSCQMCHWAWRKLIRTCNLFWSHSTQIGCKTVCRCYSNTAQAWKRACWATSHSKAQREHVLLHQLKANIS